MTTANQALHLIHRLEKKIEYLESILVDDLNYETEFIDTTERQLVKCHRQILELDKIVKRDLNISSQGGKK